MTLHEFQKLRGLDLQGLADFLGFSKSYTSQLLTGSRGFSTTTGLHIEKKTKGKVTLNDLAQPKRTA